MRVLFTFLLGAAVYAVVFVIAPAGDYISLV